MAIQNRAVLWAGSNHNVQISDRLRPVAGPIPTLSARMPVGPVVRHG